MKKISLLSLLLLSTASIQAMQEVKESISEEFDCFDCFDKITVETDCILADLGPCALQTVKARHIPSMRVYVVKSETSVLGDFFDSYSFKETKDEKSIKRPVDNKTAERIRGLIAQAYQAKSTERKAALDELHQVVKEENAQAKAWAFAAGMCN